MPDRTELVCLHEGKPGRSIDGVFINRLIRSLDPKWLRPTGSNTVRLVAGGGRTELIERFPSELAVCRTRGSTTTLMVWADLDHDMPDGMALRERFRQAALQSGLTNADVDTVVFAFAKDRLENWIQFLDTGATDESVEGPRVTNSNSKLVADAARKLAGMCTSGAPIPGIPPSLKWSCENWKALVDRFNK